MSRRESRNKRQRVSPDGGQRRNIVRSVTAPTTGTETAISASALGRQQKRPAATRRPALTINRLSSDSIKTSKRNGGAERSTVRTRQKQSRDALAVRPHVRSHQHKHQRQHPNDLAVDTDANVKPNVNTAKRKALLESAHQNHSKRKLQLDQLEPLEMLVLVCSFLDIRSHGRFARVARVFHDASRRRMAWCTRLDLFAHGAAISDRVLQQQFAHQTNLTSVNLNYCRELTARGLSAFANARLRSLLLQSSCDQHNVLDHLSDIKSTELRHLDVSQNRQCMTDQVMNVIVRAFRALRTLNLSGSHQVSAQAFAQLSQLRFLDKLDLCSCRKVTSQTLSHLQQLSGLRCLKLCDTSIDDDGMMHVAALRALTTLTMSRTAVGDLGLEHLRKCISLTCLNIAHTRATSSALSDLLKSLRIRLTSLTLGGSAVTNDVLKVDGLSLQELHLTNCSAFGDAGLAALATGCLRDSLTSLTLENCTLTDDGLACLPNNMRRLQQLVLTDYRRGPVPSLCGRALEHVSRISTLRRLGLHWQAAFGNSLRLLDRLPRLLELDFRHCVSLNDRECTSLQHMPSLQILNLSHCIKLTDRCMHVVANRCPALGRVVLYRTHISRRGMSTLKSLTHLQNIVLDYNKLTQRLDLPGVEFSKYW